MSEVREYLVVGVREPIRSRLVELLRRDGLVHVAQDEQEARALLIQGVEGSPETGPGDLVAAFVGEVLPTDRWPLLPQVAVVAHADAGADAIDDGADLVLSTPLDSGTVASTLKVARKLRQKRFCEAAARELAQHVSDAVGLSDESGRLLNINPAFVSLTGYSREQAVGKTGPELFQCCSFKNAETFREIAQAVSTGEGWRGPMTSRHRDGSPLHHHATIRPILDERGMLRRQVVIKQHLPFSPTMRSVEMDSDAVQALSLQEMLARLVHSETRYRAMMASANDAIVVSDLEHGRIIDANPAAAALFGLSTSALHGKTLLSLATPSEQGALRGFRDELRETASPGSRRVRFARADGEEVWTTVSSASFQAGLQKLYLSVIRDISADVAREQELERANTRLAQLNKTLERSARMAALGSLAGALAHEINNPLHFVSLTVEHLAERLANEDPDLRSLLEDLDDGLRRIRSTTRTVLPFVRYDSNHVEELDVNEVVRLAFKMAHNEMQHRARAELHLTDLPPLVGHRGMLGQVFTNLVVNAAQAIEEGDADHQLIDIATRVDFDAVEVVISDSGGGVPESLRERVFEQFFTTKPGEGAGIGLSVCADVVRAHAGSIRIEDSPFGGATFRVRLPFENGLRVDARAPAVSYDGVGGHLLLVDDEVSTLRSVARVLKRDFSVEIAEGGEEALASIEASCKRGTPFDAVVCDVMMPGLDGRQLYEIVRVRYPRIAERFIFCTGGAFTQKTREFLADVGLPVLDKPVATEQLRRVVAAVLAGLAGAGRTTPIPDRAAWIESVCGAARTAERLLVE